MKKSRSARLLILTLIGGAAAYVSSIHTGRMPLSANVHGALELEPKAKTTESNKAEPTDKASKLSPVLIGDSSLRGELDLSKAKLDGDHYTVALAGGRKAVLTLDPTLQKAAENVLDRTHAPEAAVVIMSIDGRLLAYAGHREGSEKPAYDLGGSVWGPAASVFKIITTSALLDNGVEPSTKTCFHGGLRSIDKDNLVDDPKHDSQCETLGYAVAKSQNAIIAKLVHKHLERPVLQEAANNFGFDAAADFALDVEPNRINLPNDDLELARVSAGFWSTEISPLAGALIANTVASDGLRVTPRIVAEVIDKDGTRRPVVGKAPTRALDEKIAAKLASMLTGTTEMGTAYHGFHDDKGQRFLGEVKVAGKTGSLTRGSPSYRAYSWFVGFAPADDPQISVAVLLGNPEKWYLKAHTAARLVLQQAFAD